MYFYFHFLMFFYRSRGSFTSDRGSPWTNTFHVQQNGRRDDDDGGFLNNSGSQRGSFTAKRDSLVSREQISGAISNHVSNRDLTATPSSVVTGNSLPRSTHNNMDTPSYTPRSYTPRSEVTSLPRNHANHTNSSLSRAHSTKMEPTPLPRSHSNMDTLGRGKQPPEHNQSSASLPRTSAALMVNGGTHAKPLTNHRLDSIFYKLSFREEIMLGYVALE